MSTTPRDSRHQRGYNRHSLTARRAETMVFLSYPADHLEKLRRIAQRLHNDEMHADDMDDFCKTAWHLIELIKKNPSSTMKMRSRAIRLRDDRDMVLCEHLANVSKHGKSRPKTEAKAGLSTIEIEQGWGVGRFGKGGFGVGEQAITLKFKDGSERDAFEFVEAVLRKWEAVFAP